MKKNIMSKTYFKQIGTHSFKRIEESVNESFPKQYAKAFAKATGNEAKFKKGQTVKYIVPGTSDKMKTGKITGFESTRDEDFAVIDGKTISFSHISESVNEGYYDFFKHQDLLDDATMSEIEGTAVSSQAIEGLKRAATVIWRDMEGTQYEDLYVKFLISTIADQ